MRSSLASLSSSSSTSSYLHRCGLHTHRIVAAQSKASLIFLPDSSSRESAESYKHMMQLIGAPHISVVAIEPPFANDEEGEAEGDAHHSSTTAVNPHTRTHWSNDQTNAAAHVRKPIANPHTVSVYLNLIGMNLCEYL